MFLGIPPAFPSGQKEALKERLENQTLENLERENLTFLDEDQHPLELAGNFLKAESGVLLENGALGEGVCCTGSLAMLVNLVVIRIGPLLGDHQDTETENK